MLKLSKKTQQKIGRGIHFLVMDFSELLNFLFVLIVALPIAVPIFVQQRFRDDPSTEIEMVMGLQTFKYWDIHHFNFKNRAIEIQASNIRLNYDFFKWIRNRHTIEWGVALFSPIKIKHALVGESPIELVSTKAKPWSLQSKVILSLHHEGYVVNVNSIGRLNVLASQPYQVDLSLDEGEYQFIYQINKKEFQDFTAKQNFDLKTKVDELNLTHPLLQFAEIPHLFLESHQGYFKGQLIYKPDSFLLKQFKADLTFAKLLNPEPSFALNGAQAQFLGEIDIKHQTVIGDIIVEATEILSKGPPIANFKTSFKLARPRRKHHFVKLKKFEFDLLDGQFTVAPMKLDLKKPFHEQSVYLKVKDLPVSNILNETNFNDFQTNMILSGYLPFKYQGLKTVIQNGYLGATKAGYLKLNKAAVQKLAEENEVLAALADFEFEQVEIDVASTPQGLLTLDTAFQGKGKLKQVKVPINLNIKVSQNWHALWESLSVNYKLDKMLKEVM